MNETIIKVLVKLFTLIEGRLSQNICKVGLAFKDDINGLRRRRNFTPRYAYAGELFDRN